MKKCYKCKKEKLFEEFSKNKRYKDGRNDICRICKSNQNKLDINKIKEYRLKNKEYSKNYFQEYKVKNFEAYRRNYNKSNKKKNKDIIKKDNEEAIKSGYKKNWSKTKYKNDINFKLRAIIRIRILDALKKKINKKDETLELLGCSIEYLKKYLEYQFLPEMNWSNYGKIWEIDHIIPCSKFDLTELEEQKKCFNYSNTQPLFKTTQIAESFGYFNIIGNRNKINKVYVSSSLPLL